MGMTDPVFLEAMQACIGKDPESAHLEADRLLCDVLVSDGHHDLVALYGQVRKWYA